MTPKRFKTYWATTFTEALPIGHELKKKYASVSIPEYWIIISQKGIIEVYKNPSDDNYAEKSTYNLDSNWRIDVFDLPVKAVTF